MIQPLSIRAHCVFGALGRKGGEDPEAFETGSLPVSPDLLLVFLSGKISPQVAGKPPRTSPVSSASLQSLRSIAAWITQNPSAGSPCCLSLSTAQSITTSSRTNPVSSRRPPMDGTRWRKPPLFLLLAPCSAHSPSHGALARCFGLCQRLT